MIAILALVGKAKFTCPGLRTWDVLGVVVLICSARPDRCAEQVGNGLRGLNVELV